MYQEAAPFYDVIHESRGRDADAEAELVLNVIRRCRPDATTLLDVGCGTGAHLPRFAAELDVTGLDASPQMLEQAAVVAPGVPLLEGDCRTFDLGRSFDAVVSLFSGIGYLTSETDLRVEIQNMARHLHPGGVLLVEGWVEPEHWLGDSVSAEVGQRGDLAVTRATRTTRDGPLTEAFMRYVAATPEGFTQVDEHHVLRLSDPDEFTFAFEVAGLAVERLPHLLHAGRSTYCGVSH